MVITAKRVESEETVTTRDSMVKINGIYLTESKAIGHLMRHPLQLTYDGDFSKITEQDVFKGATSLPFHLRSGGSVFFSLNFQVRATVSFTSLFSL